MGISGEPSWFFGWYKVTLSRSLHDQKKQQNSQALRFCLSWSEHKDSAIQNTGQSSECLRASPRDVVGGKRFARTKEIRKFAPPFCNLVNPFVPLEVKARIRTPIRELSWLNEFAGCSHSLRPLMTKFSVNVKQGDSGEDRT